MLMCEYFSRAISFAFYKDTVTYPALGLAGEAGEVAEKVKKLLRDTNIDMTDIPEDKAREIAKELGDVLWYVANLAADLHYTLDEIAEMNLAKLSDRADRNVLKGSGDNR